MTSRLVFFGWTGYQSLQRYIGFNNLTCEYESDLRSNNKAVKIRSEKIQACTGFESVTTAIQVQCSTN